MEERIKKGDQIVDIEGELKPGEGIQVDKDTKYEYGSDLSTDGVPLIDPGTGKTVAIRTFEYKINPEYRTKFPDNKQLIFNLHAKQIATQLWGDGLRPLDGVSPRVIINVKKGFYKIIVAAEARLNAMFAESPKNLTIELVRERKKVSSTAESGGTTGDK